MLDLLSFTIGLINWLTALVAVTEQIDVVVVFTLDQTSKIFVIESFVFTSSVADHTIVVQIDLNWTTGIVEQRVEVFCTFHILLSVVDCCDVLIISYFDDTGNNWIIMIQSCLHEC